MAKNQIENTEKDYYSHIIIDKGRRAFLWIVVIATILVFGSLIFENIISERNWLSVATPIIIIGSLFVLFPPTEQWTYQAWQSKPRMVERHSND